MSTTRVRCRALVTAAAVALLTHVPPAISSQGTVQVVTQATVA